MDYSQVCKYLDDTLVFGIKPGLERIKKLLYILEDPQENIDFIHIVGTNGKTSTSKITAAILNCASFTAGYYISPHINSYRERISIKGADISEDDFTAAFNDIYPSVLEINKMDINGDMTQFEILTAMMFTAAYKSGLDVMVMEAGMGGRWDATNAADAKVSGLTGVSLEHTEILGGSIREIALEKVEVIKKNTMAATASTDDEVLEIIRRKADKEDSILYEYGKDFYIEKIIEENIGIINADYKGIYNTYKSIKALLAGGYQKYNISLAIALSELFSFSKGVLPDNLTINEALKNTNITGRFDIKRKEPYFIADASHNPEGIKSLVKTIKSYFNSKRKIIIFSVLKDKDFKEMASDVLSIADIIILSSSGSERSLEVDKLGECINEILKTTDKKSTKEIQIIKIAAISDAIKYSLKVASKDDIICLTGSITNLEFVKSEFF